MCIVNMEQNAFDKVEKEAINLLFKSFCNHLYLGQWHLAKSCVGELYARKEECGFNVRDALLSVARNPYNVRSVIHL